MMRERGLASLGFKQSAFCKRDAFISQRCDSDACHDAGQIDGFLSVWRRSSHAVRVAGSWVCNLKPTLRRLLSAEALMISLMLPG